MKAPAYSVSKSRAIQIKELRMGAGEPLVLQSMANTDTLNIEESLAQAERMAKAGAQMIRFTTQGLKEVAALHEIKKALLRKNLLIPVVADVHFSARVACEAAKVCDKVRINPGNFTEKSIAKYEFSEEEFQTGFMTNKAALLELIDICKAHNTGLRIGVNHGSLSRRMMSRYGDTPKGMVESAMEFLRICRDAGFQNLVVSLKSSNTRVMVQSVRLLTSHMLKEGLYYPLHLGVTESGDGPEGRIKSVIGMAPLLLEGMGDTIRVSLTEAPENELPVAKYIKKVFSKPTLLPYHPLEHLPWDPFHYEKPDTYEVLGIGGKKPPVVIAEEGLYEDPQPDILVNYKKPQPEIRSELFSELLPSVQNINETDSYFICAGLTSDPKELIGINSSRIIILDAEKHPFTAVKHWLITYRSNGGKQPLILRKEYTEKDEESFVLRASGEFGLLLIDDLLNGLWLENKNLPNAFNKWLAFYMLQASRNRITSTEYIACPSCGRTLFDIQSVLKEVRTATKHLKGLKIAVMGCIVNGPGEMADADYGYVGAGRGLVSIYKGREVLQKNIPAQQAVQQLVHSIRENGDWVDP